MNQDCFFSIGKTHRICQDYAMGGSKNNLPFVVVSDGCSSSKLTDFGSRFLCKSIEEMIYTDVDISSDGFLLLHNAYIKSRECLKEFPKECLDATLLMARVYDNKSIRVFVTGDGVVAAKRRDGVIIAKSIQYKDNAPLYLSYHYDQERKNLLKETYDCTKIITNHFIGKGLSPITEISTNEMEIYEFPISEFSHVSIMTDGVESFQRTINDGTTKSSESVHLEEILPDLMSYKNDTGEFVQRRSQKFLKECTEYGIYHNDDFSIATISM